jgi:hypothetical protein
MTSTLVFHSQFDSFEEWRGLLAPLLPGVRIRQAEDIEEPDTVHTTHWRGKRRRASSRATRT